MEYRSLSFHEGWPNLDLVRLGRTIGFNDLCFQTEHGTVPRLEDLRRRADEKGYFRVARELGYTISVWAHELNEAEPDWLPVTVDNQKLWDGLRARYRWVLGELLPEIDNLVLTVVESRTKLTGQDVVVRLVEVVNEVCREFGKQLIFRTFVHHPEDQESVRQALAQMPDGIIVQTKNVPQDWHLRHIHNPLLGKVGGRKQFVELDICGEYWREDQIPNVFTHILVPQFRHWQEAGVQGISVRVDRGWRPWERQACVLHQAQEANLWVLGYLASGKTDDPADALRAWAEHYFGDAASTMIEALEPTGRVVEEAVCVEREPFGNGRCRIPAGQTLQQLRRWIGQPGDPESFVEAEAYPDEKDVHKRSPFHRYFSVFRWAPEYAAEFHRLRKGEPDIIKRKALAYEQALDLAEQNEEKLESVREILPSGAYPFFRFKLDENRLHLIVMCEMELAWLKAERRLYTDDEDERDRLLDEIQKHLQTITEFYTTHAPDTCDCHWQGRDWHLERFTYIDIPGFLREFRRYFRIPGPAHEAPDRVQAR